MARASTKTLLPLDRFAQLLGLHPLHFNQVEVPTLAESQVCDSPLIQYAWQDADRVGREEIAQAVADAENQIALQTGFKLLPTWEVNEVADFPRPKMRELISSSGRDITGRLAAVQAKWKQLIYGGVKAQTVIQLTSPVVYSDLDGDGYNETATIIVATTVTNGEEIRIYYPGKLGDDTYEIRPITVVISGGIATITCRREQLTILELQEKFNPESINGLDDANFLDSVDIYRVFTDNSFQGEMAWENINTCNCNSLSCSLCTEATQDMCLIVTDKNNGFFRATPGEWDLVNNRFVAASYPVCRAPDKLYLYYKAGWTYNQSHIKMDPMFERAVVYLAVTLLDRPLCACKNINAYVEKWQEDLAVKVSSQAGVFSHRIPENVLKNPFGTKQGAIYAWRIVQNCLGNGLNA